MATKVRKGTPSPQLEEPEFKRRFRAQFQDRAFDPLQAELERVTDAAWQAYAAGRKSPRTRKAGPEFEDPEFDLAIDWYLAHQAVKAAQARHDDPSGPLRILAINGASRSEHTCPAKCRNPIA